jgi:hypothetical protein
MTKRFLAVLAALVVGACATDAGSGLNPPAPHGGQQLATESYKLAPGQEKYMCYQFYSPKQAVAITKVDSISMPGVHHVVLFQSFGTNEPDPPHECPELVKTSWMPIWASGTGSKDMTLPDGTGFVIQPHTQYVIQLHMVNATDNDLDIRVGINLSYDHQPDALTPAGLYALGTFKLEIPAKTMDYQYPIDCAPKKAMNVFTVFPHMHKIGTKLEVTKTTSAGAAPVPFYTIDPWVFGNQPMDPITTAIQPGDTLHAVCHYDNPTDAPVVYGESTQNEMCFFVMFYYPYTGLDGCIDGL